MWEHSVACTVCMDVCVCLSLSVIEPSPLGPSPLYCMSSSPIMELWCLSKARSLCNHKPHLQFPLQKMLLLYELWFIQLLMLLTLTVKCNSLLFSMYSPGLRHLLIIRLDGCAGVIRAKDAVRVHFFISDDDVRWDFCTSVCLFC